jgi:hypothetical protein
MHAASNSGNEHESIIIIIKIFFVCAGKPDGSKEEHKQGLISVWEDKELEQGELPR